jgi:MFS family permease
VRAPSKIQPFWTLYGAFVLVMAQPNLATPFLPVYRLRFALTPLGLTIVFSAYLIALVPSLLVAVRIARRHAYSLVLLGTACAIGSDAFAAYGSGETALLVSRVLSGLAVGAATGPCAALLLAARGESARTMLATGTVGGAALGTLEAGIFGEYASSPIPLSYLSHAVLIGVSAILVVAHRTQVNPAVATSGGARPPGTPEPATERMLAAIGYLGGIAGWTMAGLVVSLVPSYLRESSDTTSVLVPILPVVAFLVIAQLSQRMFRRSAYRALSIGHSLLLLGATLLAVAGWTGSLAAFAIACCTSGLGQGLCFRSGLAIVSGRSTPEMHARISSTYAALSYLAAAVLTPALGTVATHAGFGEAFLTATVVFLVMAGPTLGRAGQRGRRRDSG